MGYITQHSPETWEFLGKYQRRNCHTIFLDMTLKIVIVAHLVSLMLSNSPTEVVRGPVNHALIIPVGGSCLGQEDGTKCNKRCQDLTCSSILARCFKDHCKRFPNHPCDTSDNHSCCCGNCYLSKDHKENLSCFENFL